MTCRQVQGLLLECWGAEDTLVAEAQEHLRQCAECRHEAALLRATKALLTDMPWEQVPPGFHSRVMERVETLAPQRQTWSERVWEWLWPTQHTPAWSRLLAVAAVLVLVVAGFALLQSQGHTPNVPPVPSMIAAGSGSGAVTPFTEADLEALLLRHQALELNRALSDDPGVHMVSYH